MLIEQMGYNYFINSLWKAGDKKLGGDKSFPPLLKSIFILKLEQSFNHSNL